MARRRLRSISACDECGGTRCDMECPEIVGLEEVLEYLTKKGYAPHFDDIDAARARDGMSLCTNCGERGRFNYSGMMSEKSYRAFWSSEMCEHWIEVWSVLTRSRCARCEFGRRKNEKMTRRVSELRAGFNSQLP